MSTQSDHYDSAEAEAIDWYQHYMSIPDVELAVQYALKSNDGEPITTAMEMAMEQRSEDIAQQLVEGNL